MSKRQRMNSEAKGQRLAATDCIQKLGDYWQVPSENSSARYKVHFDERDMDKSKCNCPRFDLHGDYCKHLWAVMKLVLNERNADVKIPKKITYSQDWPAYNAAQCIEKGNIEKLASSLCTEIEEPNWHFGRTPHQYSDIVPALIMKVYSNGSGRRATTDIRECAAKGLIKKVPHYNSLFRYMDKPELTPILFELIKETAKPLAGLDETIAIDATGLTATEYQRWFDVKYGRNRKEIKWIKLHICVGVRTGIITAAKLTRGDSHDSLEFKELIGNTAVTCPEKTDPH